MRLFTRVFGLIFAFFHSAWGGYDVGKGSSGGSHFQKNAFTLRGSPSGSQSGGGTFGASSGDLRYPPVGDSYWIPYGDRTVAAMTFPVVTNDHFTPVTGKGWGWQPKKLRMIKPKSDVGVVVSRNSVLKRNFRDYANLLTYTGDSRASNELVSDLARSLSGSSRSSKTKETFIVVTLESKLKTGSPGDSSGRLGSQGALHNGTLVFPSSSSTSSQFTAIPFTLRNLHDVSNVFEFHKNLPSHEEMQAKTFLKLILGVHKDTFEDGRAALDRFHRRSSSLSRPSFGVSVEVTRSDRRDDTEDKRRREETAREERRSRGEAWFSTSTIGIRTISPPEFKAHPVHRTPHNVPYGWGTESHSHFNSFEWD